jgi:benzoyl-CoA reductase/2-hydroxyglutaryl-CoA dehydratase subunit BcrC/BadD/HgdB
MVLGSVSSSAMRRRNQAVNRIGREKTGSIFTTCSCVPDEIITAAGFRAPRVLPENPPADADSHIHPNTCGYVKSLLAAGLGKRDWDPSCIVIGNSCDGMRKLYDLWQAYVPRIPAFFVDAPRKKDADSISFFASELRRFARELEEAFPGVAVTDESLRKAIETHNRIRLLMSEVFRLQREKQGNVRGSDVFDLCLRATRTPPQELIARLEGFLSSAEAGEPCSAERRLLLTGNVINRPDPIAVIEDLGSRVVVLDTCIGLRHYESLVEQDAADPMLALATRYLTRPSCPRMEGLEERFEYLRRLAEEAEVDGIVYSCIKFCDPLIYDIPLMSDWFRSAGIPFLHLENDYTWSGSGQLKTRLQAFTELEPRRRSRDV